MSLLLSPEFEDECEGIALELRRELGLAADTQLNPRWLAEKLLAINVITLERYSQQHPEAVARLTDPDAVGFDAAMVFCGTRCLIVVNPSQGASEEALSIAHEIAHIELEHERLQAPLFDSEGHRLSWRPEDELAAEYLARALLVPSEAVRPVLTRFMGSARETGAHFGVSSRLIRQRLLETDPRFRGAPKPLEPGEDGPIRLQRLTNGGGEGEPATAGSTG